MDEKYGLVAWPRWVAWVKCRDGWGACGSSDHLSQLKRRLAVDYPADRWTTIILARGERPEVVA